MINVPHLILKEKLKNYPLVLNDFNQGATQNDIVQLENTIHISFPLSFKEYVSTYDGQKGNIYIPSLPYELLSLINIKKEWNIWKELLRTHTFSDFSPNTDKQINPVWWDENWIPIASNDYGDCICLDFNPTIHGKIGQVIKVFHDDEDRVYLSPDFSSWLRTIVLSIPTGEHDELT